MDGGTEMNWFFWQQPGFAAFAPFVKATQVRGTGHHRFELYATPEVKALALDYEAACITCGSIMRPFRQRKDKTVYLSVSCPLQQSIPCARNAFAVAGAQLMYEALR